MELFAEVSRCLAMLMSKGEAGSPAGLATCDQNSLSIHPTLANFKVLIMDLLMKEEEFGFFAGNKVSESR